MGVKIKELLPIGSVIWLKEAKRPLMIFGVRQTELDTHKEYDYIGVLYPEGNMGNETQFLFQHEDIERVVFRGYEDQARNVFIEKLAEVYANDNKTVEM